MGENYYPPPRMINRPHKTPNYVPGKYKPETYYYINTYFLQNNWLIYELNRKNQAKK